MPERLAVQLNTYDNSWYTPGAGKLKLFMWYFVNAIFFINPLNPISSLKVSLLRLFGARVGERVLIKPGVNIKYPWHLEVGNECWIGEGVWIDNLTTITIGNNVCLSQGAMLLTGNHNYKSSSFDLLIGEIVLEDGVWVGAQATVCPGVKVRSHAVLAVGSIATKELEPYTIYQGNPAVAVRKREILR